MATRAKFNPEVGRRSRHKLIGTVLGFKAWIVLSWIVREYESEFASGGNHGRYPEFIPEKELWLEIGLTLNDYDLCGVTIHEALEAEIMSRAKMSYNKAHEIADFYEKKFRAHVKKRGWGNWDVDAGADSFAREYLAEIER